MQSSESERSIAQTCVSSWNLAHNDAGQSKSSMAGGSGKLAVIWSAVVAKEKVTYKSIHGNFMYHKMRKEN